MSSSEKPSSAERIGAGFRNVQKYLHLSFALLAQPCVTVAVSYLRGRSFPGTVRLRRSQDQDHEKTNHSNATRRLGGSARRSRTDSGTELSNLPINFKEQSKEEGDGREESVLDEVPSSGDLDDRPTPNRSTSAVRIAKFNKILEADMVNLDALRELAWSGVPPNLRPKIWKLLLNYAPPNRSNYLTHEPLYLGRCRERQASVLGRKRKEYHDLVAEYCYHLQDLRSEEEIGALRQVVVDVPRTAPGVQILQTDRLQKSLEHILYVWGIRHPASGYVQGINDLVTPFLIVFLSEHCEGPMEAWDISHISQEALLDVEADSYWCLCKLLDSIQDHYTSAQPGIQRAVFKIRELIRRIDGATADHLDANGIDFLQFAFRWVNCLLLREIPFSLAFRLWDTYLAEGSNFKDFLVYVCACFLLQWSETVKALDFQDIVLLLQRPPTQQWTEQEIELILSQAFMYRTSFDTAKSHLQSM